jgi:drug/metabolite transporter (DMT)-like permease
MTQNKKNLIKLHFAVFLFGFAALFGKLLTFSPLIIVFGRTFFAVLAMVIFMVITKKKFKLDSFRDYLNIGFVGCMFAVHWYTFFKSIQVSSVAIAVLTFSTFPIFVTFMEPYFSKEKIKRLDIITALITLLGVALVIPKFELSNNFTQGALWGVASGFTCSILAVSNRINVQKYSSYQISLYQNIAASFILLPFIIKINPVLNMREILLLLLLGVVFTAFTNILFISSLSTVKAQLASIITCLEPVYAIVVAGVILHEVPSIRTLLGGSVILSAVIIASIYHGKQLKKEIILQESL